MVQFLQFFQEFDRSHIFGPLSHQEREFFTFGIKCQSTVKACTRWSRCEYQRFAKALQWFDLIWRRIFLSFYLRSIAEPSSNKTFGREGEMLQREDAQTIALLKKIRSPPLLAWIGNYFQDFSIYILHLGASADSHCSS